MCTNPTCAQASPTPAMQEQCPQMTSPVSLTAIHTFKGGIDNDCECFTTAVNKQFLVPSTFVTTTLLTLPLNENYIPQSSCKP